MMKKHNKQSGFTLFIALVIAGTLLLVSTGIANLAVKSSLISSTSKESQYAFYAADSGIECALYWDVKNPGQDDSAFAPGGNKQSVTCDTGNTLVSQTTSGGNTISTFNHAFNQPYPEMYCAVVTVTKFPTGSTTIESKGYNTGGTTCTSSDPRRVERAVRVTY
jgi:Tfp pilus assembly protein PilX